VRLPFTTAQFLELFAEYNDAVWPLQAVLLLLGLVAAGAAFRPRPFSRRLVPLSLGLLWAWAGLIWHLTFFRLINPLAGVFGLMYLVQAGLFLQLAVRPGPVSFKATRTARGLAGGVLLVLALVLYPLLARMLGHGYPLTPTFGLPCPTTIFTLGLLLWAEPAVPLRLLPIPLGWAALGMSAALQLGMREDLALGAAGAVALALVVRDRVQQRGIPAQP